MDPDALAESVLGVSGYLPTIGWLWSPANAWPELLALETAIVRRAQAMTAMCSSWNALTDDERHARCHEQHDLLDVELSARADVDQLFAHRQPIDFLD